MAKTTTTMAATKLPQVTLAFWIMKIAATTVGETGGDTLSPPEVRLPPGTHTPDKNGL